MLLALGGISLFAARCQSSHLGNELNELDFQTVRVRDCSDSLFLIDDMDLIDSFRSAIIRMKRSDLNDVKIHYGYAVFEFMNSSGRFIGEPVDIVATHDDGLVISYDGEFYTSDRLSQSMDLLRQRYPRFNWCNALPTD